MPFCNGQKQRIFSDAKKEFFIKLNSPTSSHTSTHQQTSLYMQRPFSMQKANHKKTKSEVSNVKCIDITKPHINSVTKQPPITPQTDRSSHLKSKIRETQQSSGSMKGSASHSLLRLQNGSDKSDNKFNLNKILDNYKKSVIQNTTKKMFLSPNNKTSKNNKKMQIKSLESSKDYGNKEKPKTIEKGKNKELISQHKYTNLLSKDVSKPLQPTLVSLKIPPKPDTSFNKLAQQINNYIQSTEEFSDGKTPHNMISFYNLSSKRQEELNKIITDIRESFVNWPLDKQDKSLTTKLTYYRIGKLLGKGAFGRVNLGMHKLTGKLVAIKSINKKLFNDTLSHKKVMKEFDILKRLKHPNVMRLYETFESENHILFVTELCAGGDLLNYVRKRRKLREEVAKVAMKQIFDGLYYIHSKSILHRDIKLDNILLNTEGEIKVSSQSDMRFRSK